MKVLGTRQWPCSPGSSAMCSVPIFFSVPLDLAIRFDQVGNLTGFTYNVEKKLILHPEDRILYRIQEVGYNIVSYDEPQTADISMIAYYYQDPKFPDLSA